MQQHVVSTLQLHFKKGTELAGLSKSREHQHNNTPGGADKFG